MSAAAAVAARTRTTTSNPVPPVSNKKARRSAERRAFLMGKGRYTWFFGCKRMKKEGSSVREEIRVTLLANAGVLLEGAGARLLIDGL